MCVFFGLVRHNAFFFCHLLSRPEFVPISFQCCRWTCRGTLISVRIRVQTSMNLHAAITILSYLPTLVLFANRYRTRAKLTCSMTMSDWAVGWIIGHEVNVSFDLICIIFLCCNLHFIVLMCFASLNPISFAQAVHSFENCGRLYDELGHNVQWWTAADKSRFEQRADCIASFYSVRLYLHFFLRWHIYADSKHVQGTR